MRPAVVAALCWPLIGWALWRFGPTAVGWGLPLHEVVTRLLLGSAFELNIHPVAGTANTLEMNVYATRRALTCGAGLVVPGDAWRVHTSLFHGLQQWWIALAALLPAAPQMLASHAGGHCARCPPWQSRSL